jgi:hypothetical protein
LFSSFALLFSFFNNCAQDSQKENIPDVPAITKMLSQKNQPCGGLDKHATREMTLRT